MTAIRIVDDHLELGSIGSNTHAQIDSHISNTTNPHTVTKAQVGLGSTADGAEVNVQSDWDAVAGDALILNKPSDITDLSGHGVAELSDVSGAGSGIIISDAERTKLSGIETGATTDQTKADIDGLGLSHDSLVDVSANDHHNELHSIASHSDTSATGAQLDTLTDNSIADILHRHSELVASDGSPDPALSINTSGNATFVGSINAKNKIIVTGSDATFAEVKLMSYSDTNWHGCYWINQRSRGVAGLPTTVVSGDNLFTFDVFGHDGTSLVRGGQLAASVDGAVSTGVVPMRWQFKTVDSAGNYAVRMTIKGSGQVGLGTSTPATSALMDLTSTTGAFLLTRMTTAQKNALTAVNGMVLYDSTLNKFQGYENGAWTNLI